MQDTPAAEVESVARTRPRRRWRRLLIVFAVMALLLGVPWWTLLSGGTQWPVAVTVAGTAVFGLTLVGLPALMTLGHGRRRLDWAAATGDGICALLDGYELANAIGVWRESDDESRESLLQLIAACWDTRGNPTPRLTTHGLAAVGPS